MLDLAQATLAVVDFQNKLMPGGPENVRPFLDNAVKLIACARCLDIPILVTEQNPDRLGRTNDVIAEALGDIPRFGKLEFSCASHEGFRAALRATGRRQVLVTGMETHICVMQTALGLKERGYESFVVRDAVLSMRDEERQAGLQRLVQEGVKLVTAQMAIFELLRAAGTPEFKRMLPLLKARD
ncbi:MAG: isochorismatase family protein [Candidatus Hydrogenedentes bacterium]|nr:isochorismatase family protein [Candidatus Hydrogenedentota bacterium]